MMRFSESVLRPTMTTAHSTGSGTMTCYGILVSILGERRRGDTNLLKFLARFVELKVTEGTARYYAREGWGTYIQRWAEETVGTGHDLTEEQEDLLISTIEAIANEVR